MATFGYAALLDADVTMTIASAGTLTDDVYSDDYMSAAVAITDQSEVLSTYTGSLRVDGATAADVKVFTDYTDGYAVESAYEQSATLNNEDNTIGICVGGTAGE